MLFYVYQAPSETHSPIENITILVPNEKQAKHICLSYCLMGQHKSESVCEIYKKYKKLFSITSQYTLIQQRPPTR